MQIRRASFKDPNLRSIRMKHIDCCALATALQFRRLFNRDVRVTFEPELDLRKAGYGGLELIANGVEERWYLPVHRRWCSAIRRAGRTCVYIRHHPKKAARGGSHCFLTLADQEQNGEIAIESKLRAVNMLHNDECHGRLAW